VHSSGATPDVFIVHVPACLTEVPRVLSSAVGGWLAALESHTMPNLPETAASNLVDCRGRATSAVMYNTSDVVGLE
jgi:hypothetical protein